MDEPYAPKFAETNENRANREEYDKGEAGENTMGENELLAAVKEGL